MSSLHIALTEIQVKDNVRNEDGENYHELVQSMFEDGQLVPISVYAEDGRFVLYLGAQRLKAAKELGWATIWCVLVDKPDESQELIRKTQENIARSGMSFLEVAQVYKKLKDQGMKQQSIADSFGVGKAAVSIALKTLDADPKIQEAINEGRLSPSTAEHIIFKDPETQAVLADAVIAARTDRKVKAVVKTFEESDIILGEQTDSETHFEEDPILDLYRERIASALLDLQQVMPSWLDEPTALLQEDDFQQLLKEVKRIEEEIDD